ncbi:glycosyltransferase [Georgenia satyanarayanai]|uniref:glycosyltransferase n=1 Tax=Georgenia satyanarayanai TaxID=860221 RepID=UPI001263EC13|nr:glycosyltransferase [Georgenia satyanarayanai]
MKVAVWHVHGSWLTPFVTGPDEYLIPVLPDRGPDGLGRARTWDWPANARELSPAQLREEGCDVVVLQRPHEIALFEEWTGLRPGRDVPAVYVEHNTPNGDAVRTRHPLADRDDIPVVHVTHFNALVWDCGRAPTTVIDHGVLDPGPLYTGEEERVGVVVNEPVRRWRVAGTDVVLDLSRTVPLSVYGMGMAALAEHAPHLAGHLHEDVRQSEMHPLLGRQRAYLHPYRWTSLGLSLIEAMMIGLPVLALATTAAPEAVPPDAGVVSADPRVLEAAARRWLADPAEARERGQAARRHATEAFSAIRFLADWQSLLKEVVR